MAEGVPRDKETASKRVHLLGRACMPYDHLLKLARRRLGTLVGARRRGRLLLLLSAPRWRWRRQRGGRRGRSRSARVSLVLVIAALRRRCRRRRCRRLARRTARFVGTRAAAPKDAYATSNLRELSTGAI